MPELPPGAALVGTPAPMVQNSTDMSGLHASVLFRGWAEGTVFGFQLICQLIGLSFSFSANFFLRTEKGTGRDDLQCFAGDRAIRSGQDFRVFSGFFGVFRFVRTSAEWPSGVEGGVRICSTVFDSVRIWALLCSGEW